MEVPMNVSLTPELERFITKKVQTGMYHSASEVIREGLRLLKENDNLQKIRFDALRKEIAIGIEDIEQGKYKVYDARDLNALLDEVKANGRKKMAGPRKPRQQ
jgi:antitoxin ParD1/3/4